MHREVIISLLNEGLVKLKFTKADGSIRNMLATRYMPLIPTENHPKTGSGDTQENQSTIRCYDVENDGWRSFKLDSLISINVGE